MITIKTPPSILTAIFANPLYPKALAVTVKIEGEKWLFKMQGISEEAIREWEYGVRQVAKETVYTLAEAVDRYPRLLYRERNVRG